MSRIIEFRAWDKEEKEYYYDVEHTYDFFCSGRGCYAESFGEVLNQPDRFIVEQFTGLLDRNGKEIYEGDIVKWLDGLNEYIAFSVEWQENRARFCLRNQYNHYDYEDLNDKKKPYIEVIGNIHEPPKDFRPEHLKRMGVSISKGGRE